MHAWCAWISLEHLALRWELKRESNIKCEKKRKIERSIGPRAHLLIDVGMELESELAVGAFDVARRSGGRHPQHLIRRLPPRGPHDYRTWPPLGAATEAVGFTWDGEGEGEGERYWIGIAIAMEGEERPWRAAEKQNTIHGHAVGANGIPNSIGLLQSVSRFQPKHKSNSSTQKSKP